VAKIQAVTHEGGTGRIQTVRRNKPLYYRAIEFFGQATGVPVLLNTISTCEAGYRYYTGKH
jgi:carbamoyltransferase